MSRPAPVRRRSSPGGVSSAAPWQGRAGVAVAGLVSAGLAASVLRPLRRVVVRGASMEPTLEPGDRLLVVRVPAAWPLRRGAVVALHDPRRPDRMMVKRVVESGATVAVAGDNAASSTDSRTFGRVPRRSVVGLACYRYAPADRAGWLGRPARPRPRRSGLTP